MVGRRLTIAVSRSGLLLCSLASIISLHAADVCAQDDMMKLVEAKRNELKVREETVQQEEKRLNALRKDVDEKIAAYTRLLARVEEVTKKLELSKGEKIENIVKAYESMTAEDAATRLSALDTNTAIQIMTRMKSKKAGAIIAAMPPSKAASLTRSMTTLTMKKL